MKEMILDGIHLVEQRCTYHSLLLKGVSKFFI
jgi:hypothetical protein